MDKFIKLKHLHDSQFADLFPEDEENVTNIATDFKRDGTTGLLNPPTVAPLNNDGEYEIIAGHDRIRAARLAGLKELPCRVLSMLSSDQERLEWLIKDNTARKAIDLPRVIVFMLERHKEWSDRQIAEACGCSRQRVQQIRADNPTLKSNVRVGVDGVAQDKVATISNLKPKRKERKADWYDSIPRFKVPVKAYNLHKVKDDARIGRVVEELVEMRRWIDETLNSLGG